MKLQRVRLDPLRLDRPQQRIPEYDERPSGFLFACAPMALVALVHLPQNTAGGGGQVIGTDPF